MYLLCDENMLDVNRNNIKWKDSVMYAAWQRQYENKR